MKIVTEEISLQIEQILNKFNSKEIQQFILQVCSLQKIIQKFGCSQKSQTWWLNWDHICDFWHEYSCAVEGIFDMLCDSALRTMSTLKKQQCLSIFVKI